MKMKLHVRKLESCMDLIVKTLCVIALPLKLKLMPKDERSRASRQSIVGARTPVTAYRGKHRVDTSIHRPPGDTTIHIIFSRLFVRGPRRDSPTQHAARTVYMGIMSAS